MVSQAQAQAQAAVAAAAAGGEEWARAMDDLAEACLAAGDLDRAVGVRQEALARLDPDLRATLGVDLANNLGVDLMTRYRRRSDPEDLRAACRLGEAVFAAAPAEDRLRAAVNLAGRLASLARLPGEEAALERSVELLTAQLAATGEDPWRPLAVSTLAGAHLQLWQRGGDRARLRAGLRMVTAELAAVGSVPGVGNVVGLICEAAEETSDLDLLGTAEALLRAAVDRPVLDERSSLWRLLAIVLLDRYEWTGDRAVLAEAIAASDTAVRDAERAELVDALSIRAMTRAAAARADGDRAELSAAIEDARAALAAVRHGRGDDSEYVTNLAMLLAERYDLVGDGTDLDQAIALVDGALADPPPDAFASMASNQANALLARFERDLDPPDLDRAIELVEAAIAAAPDSAQRAARHDTAGRLYAARAHHRGQPADLDAAERHATEAVRAAPDPSPDRALYLNNWAMWVTERWEQTRSEAALDQATQLLEKALAALGQNAAGDPDPAGVLAATATFNLAVRLQDRFELQIERGQQDLTLLQRVVDGLEDVIDAGHPHLTVPAGKRLGDIAWRLSMWTSGEHAFRLALDAAGELTRLRPQRPDKERARSGIQGLGALAALCAVRAGDRKAAAVHLEQASATLIAEAAGLPVDSVTFDNIVDGARILQRHVLFLGCTQAGGIAVLVGPDGEVRYAELPDLTEAAVAERTSAFRKTLERTMANLDTDDDPVRSCCEAVDNLAAWTAQVLVSPVTDLLHGVTRLAVLPVGRLSWLPVTMAQPSATDLGLAPFDPVLLIRATTATASTPTGPADPGGRRVVVWADPGPADRSIPAVIREARRVAHAHPSAELRIARRSPRPGRPARLVLRSTRLAAAGSDPAGTDPAAGSGPVQPDSHSAAVLADLLAADLVHLACHCDVDVERPQETVLHVQPPIRIAIQPATARRRTHVILSACDAALTATVLPDEALSPATGFLLAGAGVVTAPLWPVNDAAAPAFMADYHAALATGTDPARALSAVTRRWSATHPMFVYGPWVVTAWPDALAPAR